MINLSKNSEELEQVLELLSRHNRVLVASDFDGTISRFVSDPRQAVLDPLAHVALRKLSELPNTYVAVISGRSLQDLREKFAQNDAVRLVGSHGHEFDLDQVSRLTGEQRELLTQARNLVLAAVQELSGTSMEEKPHGVVFHYRALTQPPQTAIDKLRAVLRSLPGGTVREGSKVLEFSVVDTHKGEALTRIREQLLPTITLFLGDDVTDEAAFADMGRSDISIKVGDGDSAARFRVETVEESVHFLVQLAERRSAWLKTLPAIPIDEHLFLSDLRTFALVDTCGTVSWLCTPRLDGAPLFGSLIGGPTSGYFRISSEKPGTQEYIPNTLIGKTTFDGVSVTDFFDCSAGRTYQRAGRSDFIRLIEGSGEVSVEFAPKFNFGRVPTRLSGSQDGLRIECGQQRLFLLSPGWTWDIAREGMHDVARSQMRLSNTCVSLTLLLGTSSINPPSRNSSQLYAETTRFWDGWVATLKLPPRYKGLVTQSAMAIRGLTYGPTGAIAAAATTSLPETIGGARNWDYRYCWPRDACLAASALLRLDAMGPAIRLLDWILAVVIDAGTEQFLAPLYNVAGRSVPSEAEVLNALGYRGSRPVRIGNLAAEQLQLDALGPIAELMWKLALKGATLTGEHYELAERLVNLVHARWNDPDSGIWEVRGAQRHFVHSKLMCWYTVHCAVEISRYLGIERSDWESLASQIRQQIEKEGYSERLQSYVAAYDLEEADAALLWVILSGFHPPDHPRSRNTLRFIVERLVHDGHVYRYHFDDALHGQEGEFIICRAWLIEALTLCGQAEEAQALFDELLSRTKSLGLLAEQWDEKEKCALGNYPQAYSHLGLINAACALQSKPA
ncbi:MAG: trehalose-phosphatase [Deltaproteobacteria bacterium]|nr:trehalose-phosphatase [Deltaproteobacteria bacterium]